MSWNAGRSHLECENGIRVLALVVASVSDFERIAPGHLIFTGIH